MGKLTGKGIDKFKDKYIRVIPVGTGIRETKYNKKC